MNGVVELRWREKLLGYLLCYSLYVVLIALSYVVTFMIWRWALVAMIAAFMGRSDANRLIYMLGMLFAGMGVFVLVMAAEPYLREGVRRRQLRRRFVRMAAPLGIAGILGLLLLGVASTRIP